MITDILEDIEYRKIMEKQIQEIIYFLLEHNEEFSLTANLQGIEFSPKLPETIKSQFSKFTMFTLSNYTYTTIVASDTYISFEAGFGEENFGSTVTIPFYAIFQLIINESILHINPAATIEKYFINDNKNQTSQKERSRQAFMKNLKKVDL